MKVEIAPLSNTNFVDLGSKPIEYISVCNTHSAAITIILAFANTALAGGTSLSSDHCELVHDVSIPVGATLVLEEESLKFIFLNRVNVTTVAVPGTVLASKSFLIRLSSAGTADVLVKKHS
tara:strand:+ start:413 stop:775 length:363 start_codon:yes stop_codon:yes gene_type:complete